VNKIIVIGHLGRDPEMRYTPNGQSVTTFSVASSRRYTTADGERREETEWFNVSAWGRLSDLCNQYLAKGRQVYVEGRLSSRSYEARDGQTRHVNEIFLSDVQFLGGRGAEGGEGGGGGGGMPDNRSPGSSPPAPSDGGDYGYDAADDLPF
jgi:single-strand DNA-binding protein